mgnify:CR=1 FL=1
MRMTDNKYVKDFFRVFLMLNQYPWGVARDEIVFLLTFYMFETINVLRVRNVTKFLKTHSKITQADKNRTWRAGKQLIEKGLLSSPRVGYYQTTPSGRERVRKL